VVSKRQYHILVISTDYWLKTIAQPLPTTAEQTVDGGARQFQACGDFRVRAQMACQAQN
jgi:hypothetical protein